jgi:hypothetical protein
MSDQTDKPASPDKVQAEKEASLAEVAQSISPRTARLGWMPDQCRNFEEWDR